MTKVLLRRCSVACNLFFAVTHLALARLLCSVLFLWVILPGTVRAQAAVITLEPGVTDTREYGYHWGSEVHQKSVEAEFTSVGVDMLLSVKGYDIDQATEVSVLLNGNRIGYFPPSGNNTLGSTTEFQITAAQQQSGVNSLSFVQRTAGWRWGVTDVVLTTVEAGGSGTVPAPEALLVAVADAVTVEAGGSVTIDLVGNDINNTGLDAPVQVENASPSPQRGFRGASSIPGAIQYTPYPGQTGTDTFGYRLRVSGHGVSEVAIVTVTIEPEANGVPIAANDEYVVELNSVVRLDVLGNDYDADGSVDADTLTIDTSSLNKGSASIVNGVVEYSHTDGTKGVDVFTYTVKDNAGLISETATVIVNVSSPLPEAVDDRATVVAWGDVIVDVLANDIDDSVAAVPEQVTISIMGQPGSGVATVVDGKINYVHDGTQGDTDFFTYSIVDVDQNVSNSATVLVGIDPLAAEAPDAMDDLFSLVRDTTRLITVLDNDADRNYDLDPTTLAIVFQPLHGSASIQDGQILYEHNGGNNGSDALTYSIADATGLVDEATVIISYEEINAPVAVDDSVRVEQGGIATISVLDNDTANTSLDVTSIFIIDGPDHVAESGFTVNKDGTVSYQHDGQGGIEDSFTYLVYNLQGTQSNHATVAIRINPRLFSYSELKYEGAFALPAATYGQSSLNYSRGVIEVNGDSLFIAGHAHDDAIAEFAIPQLTNSYRIEDLASAGAPRQSFSEFLSKIPGGNPDSLDQIIGIERVGDSLVVNAMEYYDGEGDNTTTTFVIKDYRNLRDSSISALHTMQGAARAAGWLTEIPEYWQQDLGASHLSGHSSGEPIISRLSVGPSAFAVDLEAIVGSHASQQIPATELQGFTLNRGLSGDLYNSSGGNDVWTHLSSAKYGFIVPGTRTYMTLGWSGGHNAGVSYKPLLENGVECPGFCANDSEDVYNHYWLWDMADWVRVQNGEIEPNTIRPYDYGTFDLPFQTAPYLNEIGGASFDSASGLLYVSVTRANLQGSDNPPVVVAYKIATTGSLPNAIQPLAPEGVLNTSSPAFKWQEDPHSDHYRLRVINNETATVLGEYTYNPAQTCVAGLCEVIPDGLVLPQSDDLIFQIRGETYRGVGAWRGMDFTIR